MFFMQALVKIVSLTLAFHLIASRSVVAEDDAPRVTVQSNAGVDKIILGSQELASVKRPHSIQKLHWCQSKKSSQLAFLVSLIESEENRGRGEKRVYINFSHLLILRRDSQGEFRPKELKSDLHEIMEIAWVSDTQFKVVAMVARPDRKTGECMYRWVVLTWKTGDETRPHEEVLELPDAE